MSFAALDALIHSRRSRCVTRACQCGAASSMLWPMPELAEVEAIRQQLRAHSRGRRIAQVFVAHDPLVVKSDPATLRSALKGRRIRDIGRRGKYLWIEVDRRPWPLIHFGMSGSVQILAPRQPLPPHTKLELELEEGTRLVFRDPRRFGRIRLLQDPLHEAPLNRLSADPLDEKGWLSSRELHEALSRSRRTLKALLLDQRLFAGVGNWLADDILYEAKLRPSRRGSSLSLAETQALRRALFKILRQAVKVDADDARFPPHWLFHVRWSSRHLHSPRGERLRREEIAGRTTVWVRGRQL